MRRPACLVIPGALLSVAVLCCQPPDAPPPDSTPPADAHVVVKQGAGILPNGAGEYLFDDAVLIDGDGGYCSTNAVFSIENQGKQDLHIYAVALTSGDTALVGAGGNNSSQGSAYVFSRNQGGTDNWGEVERITASDGDYDCFDESAALFGDIVAAGAPVHDSYRGTAYVFIR